MSRKFTILISDEEVIKKLEKLPERSKGHYITEAIKEKISKEKELVWDENKLKEIIAIEVEKLIGKNNY